MQPPVATICESFSEWHERCTEFVSPSSSAHSHSAICDSSTSSCSSSSNAKSTWTSHLVRLDRWAHASSPSASSKKKMMMQQQHLPIVSPYSRASPSLSSFTHMKDQQDAEEEEQQMLDEDNNNSDPGVLLQPLIWIVTTATSTTSAQNNNPRPIYISTAPPPLVLDFESSGENESLSIAQWHAQQVCRLLQSTPTGRRPEKICVVSNLICPALSLNRQEKQEEINSRCTKFMIQSLSLEKFEPNEIEFCASSSSSSTSSLSSENIIVDPETIQSSLDVLISKKLIHNHIIPPDQSDPLVLLFASSSSSSSSSSPSPSSSSSSANVLSLTYKQQDLLPVHPKFSSEQKEGDNNEEARVVSFTSSSSSSSSSSSFSEKETTTKYAVLIPFNAIETTKNKNNKHCLSLLANSFSPSSSSCNIHDKMKKLNPIVSIRIFSDLGDALAVREYFSSFSRNDYSEVLAPTSDLGGEIVLEFWGSKQLLASQNLKETIIRKSGSEEEQKESEIFLHAYVQKPPSEEEQRHQEEQEKEAEKVRRRLVSSNSVYSSLSLSRRSLTGDEMEVCSSLVKQLPELEFVAEDISSNSPVGDSSLLTACAWCSRVRQTNRRCGNCLCVSYCCRNHQKLHYKKESGNHKKECPAIKKERNELVQLGLIINDQKQESKEEKKRIHQTSKKSEENVANAIDYCCFQKQEKETTGTNSVVVHLPLSKFVPSSSSSSSAVPYLKRVAEELVTTTTTLSSSSSSSKQKETLFVTICCSEGEEKDQDEDFLGVVVSSEKEDFTWLPPSKALGDLWCQQELEKRGIFQEQEEEKEKRRIFCRVHRYATLPQSIENSSPRSLKVKNTSSPLVIVFTRGHEGLGFLNQVSGHCANLLVDSESELKKQKQKMFVICDSRRAAENSISVISSHALQKGEKREEEREGEEEEEEEKSGNNAKVLVRASKEEMNKEEEKLMMIEAPEVTSKLLLPLFVHGFIVRFG